MLSGREGNENSEKTTIGLISKKKLCSCRVLFLYISLPLFCTTTTWNFQKLPSYTFYGGDVVSFLVHFFFHCRWFSPWWPLVFLIFSPLQIVHVFLPTKVSPLFLSLVLALCRSFSRWSSLVWRLFSLFLFPSLSLFSKFLDMTINLSFMRWQRSNC